MILKALRLYAFRARCDEAIGTEKLEKEKLWYDHFALMINLCLSRKLVKLSCVVGVG